MPCPPEGVARQLLNRLGRRPTRIHSFAAAPGHRKLATQTDIHGDECLHDAGALREGLAPRRRGRRRSSKRIDAPVGDPDA